MRERIKAVVIVQATPMNRDGSLDLKGLKANTRFLVERCRGRRIVLVPTGSTGEAYALTDGERLRVIETVVECAGGKIPVVAGTAAAGTVKVVGWEAWMRSYVLAFMLLSLTESVPTAFSAGCVQDDETVSTPSPVPQGHTITGRVVDEEGKPVAAVTIRIADLSPRTLTNDEGRFSFEHSLARRALAQQVLVHGFSPALGGDS
jgi:hypothetical protein